jgi:hypothetical protein
VSAQQARFPREKWLPPVGGRQFEKDQAISSRQPLGDGDTIEIGASRFVFKCVSTGNLG